MVVKYGLFVCFKSDAGVAKVPSGNVPGPGQQKLKKTVFVWARGQGY